MGNLVYFGMLAAFLVAGLSAGAAWFEDGFRGLWREL